MNFLKKKNKICENCKDDKYPIWKNYKGKKYCKSCWYKDILPNISEKVKYINKVSDKQSKLLDAYSKLRKIFFSKEENKYCKAQLPGCQLHASDVHHMKKRGVYLLDITTWLSTCRVCHSYIESHPEEAKALGLTK